MYYLNKFIDFFQLEDCSVLVSLPQNQLQIMVKDYVADLKKRVNPNYFPTYIYAIQAFFETNDIELNWKKK